jgi:hypothetical protein
MQRSFVEMQHCYKDCKFERNDDESQSKMLDCGLCGVRYHLKCCDLKNRPGFWICALCCLSITELKDILPKLKSVVGSDGSEKNTCSDSSVDPTLSVLIEHANTLEKLSSYLPLITAFVIQLPLINKLLQFLPYLEQFGIPSHANDFAREIYAEMTDDAGPPAESSEDILHHVTVDPVSAEGSSGIQRLADVVPYVNPSPSQAMPDADSASCSSIVEIDRSVLIC